MVCIEKRPYTLYGRLATLHFRYLTCLLDRGHIKMSCLWLNHETQKPLSIVNKVSCYICCNNCATYHIYTRKPKSTNHKEKLNTLHLFFILVRYSFQLKLF